MRVLTLFILMFFGLGIIPAVLLSLLIPRKAFKVWTDEYEYNKE